MKWLTSRVLWGILLIVAGLIFLLDNLNLLEMGDAVWMVIFAVAAAGFLSVFIQDRHHWWSLIPGMTLLSIAVVILLDFVFPQGSDDWGGVIVLLGIALSFLTIYLNDREQWWAIIPMGVMFTITLVFLLERISAISQMSGGFEVGGIFFIGLGLTFALLGILPGSATRSREQMRWAFIPAVILFTVGMLVLGAWASLLNYIWPLALILLGLFFILRTIKVRG